MTVALVGGVECDDIATAVTQAFEGVTVREVEDPESAAALDGVDAVVTLSTEGARALLDAIEEDRGVPVVVVTDDADTGDHGRLRHHRLDDLATLERRVVDAVLAERERRRTVESPDEYEELVEREAAYRTLVENVPDGSVALFDRDLRYTWIGGEVFDLLDLSPGDVAGRSMQEVHSAAFLDAHGDALRGVFDGERSSFEFTYEGRQFRLDAVPVEEGGEVVAGMAMTRDVTDERERQRDLLVKTRAMDAAAIGLVLTDPTQEDNPLVYVNEGYQELTGYDADEVLGENPRHIQGSETEPEPSARMREAVEDVEPCAVDITNYRKDGTPFVNHVEICPIFDDEGNLVHFLGSQIDVTDQHERERALARQNEQLEEFASVVSHDLRNPLEVARGRLELYEATGDPENLDVVDDSLDRMDDLVDDLLTLAREGRTIDDDGVEPVSVADAAREAWATVDTADATLAVEDDYTVDADPARLRQLFENLFRNCVEHGSTNNQTAEQSGDSVEHGSTSSRLEAADGVSDHGNEDGADETGTDRLTTGLTVRVGRLGDHCGFFVEDDGAGIDPAVRGRVFEAGVTTTTSGTGFGLAIVRSVAEAHGWTVRVAESDTGGARFEFGSKCVNGE